MRWNDMHCYTLKNCCYTPENYCYKRAPLHVLTELDLTYDRDGRLWTGNYR